MRVKPQYDTVAVAGVAVRAPCGQARPVHGVTTYVGGWEPRQWCLRAVEPAQNQFAVVKPTAIARVAFVRRRHSRHVPDRGKAWANVLCSEAYEGNQATRIQRFRCEMYRRASRGQRRPKSVV